MEATIVRYFDGCNRADHELITSCLTPDAVHYFPPGMYDGPWRGASVIADHWLGAVARLGSYWTIEQVALDGDSGVGVAEWTHWKTGTGAVLRGDEWYRFDGDGRRLSEIRAYYATPQPPGEGRYELGGFDYATAGYALRPPTAEYPRHTDHLDTN